MGWLIRFNRLRGVALSIAAAGPSMIKITDERLCRSKKDSRSLYDSLRLKEAGLSVSINLLS